MTQKTIRLAVCLIGCAQVSCSSIHLDTRLIQAYSPELERSKPLRSPYVAIYRRGTKELIYVASRHLSTRDSPDLRDHPTFKTLTQVFADRRPEVVIIGGVPSGEELSPSWYAEYARSCEAKNYLGCGESAYAAYLADRNRIPFLNGDPSDVEIKSELIKQGLSEEDVLGFYVARQLQQHFREDPSLGGSKAALVQSIDSDLRQFQRDMKSNSRFKPAEFMSWLEKHSPTRIENFSSEEEFAPVDAGTPLQRISAQVDVLRNRVLLTRIQKMLNRYDRVLVVYGSGHLLSQSAALEHEMGKPELEKLY